MIDKVIKAHNANRVQNMVGGFDKGKVDFGLHQEDFEEKYREYDIFTPDAVEQFKRDALTKGMPQDLIDKELEGLERVYLKKGNETIPLLVKGKSVPVGSLSPNGKHKKVAEGKWVAAKGEKSEKKDPEGGKEKKMFKPFIEIAKKAKDEHEFIDKVREVKNVSKEVSETWAKKYGIEEGASIHSASKSFIKDVKEGKFD
jgi:hypothetical protein